MIGGSLSARGSDDPAAPRQTHSPTTLHPGPRRRLPRVRAARPGDGHVLAPSRIRRTRASRRASPTRRARRSGSRTTTSSSSCSARHSTAPAQPGSSLPLVYGEYGLQTVIPPSKRGVYSGAEQPTTKPIDEQRAGSGVRRGDRDRRLPADRANAALLPRVGRAAARAPPDRRLLRRRHPEGEPGSRRRRGPLG